MMTFFNPWCWGWQFGWYFLQAQAELLEEHGLSGLKIVNQSIPHMDAYWTEHEHPQYIHAL